MMQLIDFIFDELFENLNMHIDVDELFQIESKSEKILTKNLNDDNINNLSNESFEFIKFYKNL